MMSQKTALVIIDIQVGLINPNNQHHIQTLKNINMLLSRARAADMPVIYVQHDGPKGHDLEVGTDAWQIHPAIAPQQGETIVNKRASDAFYDTTLKDILDSYGCTNLIVAGAQTEYCVDTSVRRATTFGYAVVLASDAHLTRDTEILTEAQIIAFYNDTLDGFDSDEAIITVQPTESILRS
jgi:nicotinamidase-related amidase